MTQNDQHYDQVTDAWQNIMGDNFHFGYFETGDISLAEATYALIDKMTNLLSITEKSKILDVGCGIGGPAVYISQKFNCTICGISTSRKGVEAAYQKSRTSGLSARLEFKVADGTRNGLPDNSFDIVWVMESSHLMNKKALLKECQRVLKPKGTLILCDLMYRYVKPLRNLAVQWRGMYKHRHRGGVYGKTNVLPMQYYWKTIHHFGFNEITTVDISTETIPTMKHWKQNLKDNREQIIASKSYTDEDIDKFIRACNWLEMIFKNKVLGYAIIKAVKD